MQLPSHYIFLPALWALGTCELPTGPPGNDGAGNAGNVQGNGWSQLVPGEVYSFIGGTMGAISHSLGLGSGTQTGQNSVPGGFNVQQVAPEAYQFTNPVQEIVDASNSRIMKKLGGDSSRWAHWTLCFDEESNVGKTEKQKIGTLTTYLKGELPPPKLNRLMSIENDCADETNAKTPEMADKKAARIKRKEDAKQTRRDTRAAAAAEEAAERQRQLEGQGLDPETDPSREEAIQRVLTPEKPSTATHRILAPLLVR